MFAALTGGLRAALADRYRVERELVLGTQARRQTITVWFPL